MNKFNFKIEITCSVQYGIYDSIYDEHPDSGTFADDGYVYPFYIEGTLLDAMDYAEKLCISEFKTKSLTEVDPEEAVIDPYMIKIKNIIHKNIVVGGEVLCSQVDWIIPKINEDSTSIYQEVDNMYLFCDKEWDTADNYRKDYICSLARDAEFLLLRCSDYWKYTPCENVA